MNWIRDLTGHERLQSIGLIVKEENLFNLPNLTRTHRKRCSIQSKYHQYFNMKIFYR